MQVAFFFRVDGDYGPGCLADFWTAQGILESEMISDLFIGNFGTEGFERTIFVPEAELPATVVVRRRASRRWEKSRRNGWSSSD